MAEAKKAEGCVATAAGPVKTPSAPSAAGAAKAEEKTMTVMVGKEAPDFEASAFAGGTFSNIRLSSFRGKWVFLCFYPGDFTFV